MFFKCFLSTVFQHNEKINCQILLDILILNEQMRLWIKSIDKINSMPSKAKQNKAKQNRTEEIKQNKTIQYNTIQYNTIQYNTK